MESAEKMQATGESSYAPSEVDYQSRPHTSKVTLASVSISLEKQELGINIDPFIGVHRLPVNSITFLDKHLGKGNFGVVSQGQWGERLVALKEIDIARAQRKLRISEGAALEALQWEVSRLSTAIHPNLVQFYGVYHHEEKTYLVMEYCEGRDLEEALKQRSIEWSARWQWALEIAQGLAYLHHQGMLHRDLKADNILLDGHNRARLADLGVAQVDALLQEGEARVVEKGFQDPCFRAPENLKGLSSSASDVYALGLVFWQLASGGQRPHYLAEMPKPSGAWQHEPIPANCPAEFRELILECWRLNPIERPSAEQVVNRLQAMAKDFHQSPFWLKLCEEVDTEIHLSRVEGLKYLPPFLTEHQVLEDLDTYWQRLETQPYFEANIEESQALSKGGNPPLNLQKTLDEFLAQEGVGSLVLLGESGLGKTFSTYQLADRLLSQWWQYLKNAVGTAPYYPLFVRSKLNKWSHSELVGAIDKIFKSYGESSVLLKEARWLIIIDGYDECQTDMAPQNLAQSLGLANLSHVKLLVTCRPDVVESSELSARFAVNGSMMVRHFLPFNIRQMLHYLKQSLSWDINVYRQYQSNLESARELRTVLRNPFVLSLLVQSWETVSQKDFNQLNRWQIYQGFVEHWLKGQAGLLSPAVQKTLSAGYESLLESFNAFAAEIGFEVFRQKVIAFDSSTQTHSLSSDAALWLNLAQTVRLESEKTFQRRQQQLTKIEERRVLLKEEDYVAVMQQKLKQFETGSPLKKRSLMLDFSHRSFFEYFVARRIVDLRSKEKDLIVTSGIALLNGRSLQEEPESLRFITEAWQEQSTHELKESFLDIIISSRIEQPDTSQAASNAITILNAVGTPFSGMDLSKINVPSANLNGLRAHKVNFQYARLTDCTFTGAFLAGSCFDHANLKGAKFGELPTLSWPTGCVTAVQFFSKDQYLACAGDDNTISILNRETGETIKTFNLHKQRVLGLDISPDGEYLVSSSKDKTICLTNIQTGQSLRIADLNDNDRIGVIYGQYFPVIFHPHLTQIIFAEEEMIGSYKLKFIAFDFQRRISSTVETLAQGMGNVTKIEYSTDKKLLGFSVRHGQSGYESQIWDVEKKECLKVLKGYWFSFSPNTDQLAVATTQSGDKDSIQIYDLKTFTLQQTFPAHFGDSHSTSYEGSIRDLRFCPDKNMNILASSGDDNLVLLWDLSSSSQLPFAYLNGHTQPVTCLGFSSDGRLLASGTGALSLRGHGSGDRSIRLWDINTTLTFQDRVQLHRGSITGLTVLQKHRQLLTIGQDDGQIKRWSIESGRLLESRQAYPELSEFRFQNLRAITLVQEDSEEGTFQFLTVNSRKDIKLFFYKSGKIVEEKSFEAERTGIFSLSISPDKQYLAVGNFNGNVTVLKIGTFEKVFSYKAPASRVAFSTNEHTDLLLAMLGQNVLTVLNGKTGELIYQCDEEAKQSSGLGALVFSPAHSSLVASTINEMSITGTDWVSSSVSKKGTVVIWDVKKKQRLYELGDLEECDFVNCITFSPNGKFLAAGYENGYIIVWEILTSHPACILDAFKSDTGRGISAIQFSDENIFITTQYNGSIQGWKLVKNGEKVAIELQWQFGNGVVLTGSRFNETQLESSNALLVKKKGGQLPNKSQVAALEKLTLGKMLMSIKQFSSAMDCFRQATVDNPNLADAYLQLGICDLILDNMKEAENNFTLSINFSTKERQINLKARYYRGILYQKCSMAHRAMEDINIVLIQLKDASTREDVEFRDTVQKTYDNLEEQLRIKDLFSSCKDGRNFYRLFKPKDVKIKDDQGLTLLHHAIQFGQTGVVKTLLKNGADPALAEDKYKHTSLYFIIAAQAEKRSMEVIELLVKANPKVVNIPDHRGITPLHAAISIRDLELVKYLVENGASVNAHVLGSVPIPLIIAIQQSHSKIAEFLLKAGADYTIESSLGRAPLNYVTEKITSLSMRALFSNFGRLSHETHEDLQQLEELKRIGLLLVEKYRQDRKPISKEELHTFQEMLSLRAGVEAEDDIFQEMSRFGTRIEEDDCNDDKEKDVDLLSDKISNVMGQFTPSRDSDVSPALADGKTRRSLLFFQNTVGIGSSTRDRVPGEDITPEPQEDLMQKFILIESKIINGLSKEKWIKLSPDEPLDGTVYKDEPKNRAIKKLKTVLLMIKQGISEGQITTFLELQRELIPVLRDTITACETKQTEQFLGMLGITKSVVAVGLKRVLKEIETDLDKNSARLS